MRKFHHYICKNFHKFQEEIKKLKNSPHELWLCYVNKFFFSYSYFTWSIIMVLYLNEFGLSDTEAGFLYGLFGACISVFGFFVGFIIDNAGIKISLIAGSLLCVLGKSILVVAQSDWLVYFCVLFILPIGEALSIPVLVTGVQRYTTKSTSPIAFGIFYSIMNIGAIASGYGVDLFRHQIGKNEIPEKNFFGIFFSVYRFLILSCVISNIIPLLVTIFFVREVDVTEQGETKIFVPKKENPFGIIREIFRNSGFWKFLLLTLFLTNVRSIFRHMDATLPKYLQRMFGEDVPFGSVFAINPVMIVFLAPFAQIVLAPYSALTCIVIGAWITSTSPLWLWWSSSMWASIFFVVQLSLGEAIWSPRIYDYVMAIAPKGKEGTYMALSGVPLFVSQVPTGLISGWLLTTYCPGPGNCNGNMLWLVISLITMLSPILLSMFYFVIYDETTEYKCDNHKSDDIHDGDIELVSFKSLEREDGIVEM